MGRFPIGKPRFLRPRIFLPTIKHCHPVPSAACATSATISLSRRPSFRKQLDQYLVHLAGLATLAAPSMSLYRYGVLDLFVVFATHVTRFPHQCRHGLVQNSASCSARGGCDPCVLLRHLQYRLIAVEARVATTIPHSYSRRHKRQR